MKQNFNTVITAAPQVLPLSLERSLLTNIDIQRHPNVSLGNECMMLSR